VEFSQPGPEEVEADEQMVTVEMDLSVEVQRGRIMCL